MNKICNKCHQEKELSFFRDNRNSCKMCCSKQASINNKIRFENNNLLIEKRKKYLKNWRINKIKFDPFYYVKENKNKLSYKKEYIKNKIKNEPEFKILKNLRCRIYHAVKGIKKYKTEYYCGINIIELKKYLESKFKDGMSWENYGLWHIDHIIPCKYFNLNKEEEKLKCFHFSNLQPLWAKENREKGCKV